jgi:hypothetical protein
MACTPFHGVIQGALYPVFGEGNEPQTGGTPPAPLLGTLAVPRMLLDVGNHPGIENARAIVGGITAAIKLEIGSSEVQPDFFGQLFQSMGFASSAGGIVVFQEACQPHWYHEALHLPLQPDESGSA